MKPVRIAHLSDPHFGTIKPGVTEALLLTLSELKPELILLSGDITQRARPGEFRKARKFTEKTTPTPLIAVPGNHDLPLFNPAARLFWPYRGFKRLFKSHTEKDFVFKDLSIVGLNSTSRWRHIQGDFNFKRVTERLSAPYEKTKVRIAAFHHPMDCAKHIDEKNLLCGRRRAMQLFDQSQIDLIVGGHIHDPFINLSTERYPEIKRPMILSVAGTCLSSRTRAGAPNSFNLIEVFTEGDPQIRISRQDLEATKFNTKEVYNFKRIPNEGWSRLT